ncbi:MAG: DUF4325 domain-containing protein [Deferribacterales bacterium]|jgi:anti-sigma regulatory factor (Ser/Thr protein kinase)
MRERTKQIREFILENVESHPKDIAAVTAKKFDISRQAVNKHLNTLTEEDIILAKGNRNKREYFDIYYLSFIKRYDLDGLDESIVFVNDVAPVFVNFPKNTLDIIEYVFTEIVNNAIDHSEGDELWVQFYESHTRFVMYIYDNGVGIFKKIMNALQLPDEKLAILELAKGKFTTDPENHSGEGIFFSAKASDKFEIISNSNHFMHDLSSKYEDMLKDTDSKAGTQIIFEIKKKTRTTLKEIFDKYSDDEYGFTKTVVNVELLRIGNENLISRSQAKRLIARFEKFKHIELDFSNVDFIGQAFADEVFRVFQRKYPEIVLEPVNTTEDVDKMIKRARAKLKEMEQN